MSLATTMTLLLISGLHIAESASAGDRHEPLPGSPLSIKEYEKFFSVLMQQQGGLEALCAIRLRSGCRNRLLIPLDKYENHGAIPKGAVCSDTPEAPYFKDFCAFAEYRCEKKKYTLKRVKCVGDIMYEKTHTIHRDSLENEEECNSDDSITAADEDTDDITALIGPRPFRRKMITNWMLQTSRRARWRTSQRPFRDLNFMESQQPYNDLGYRPSRRSLRDPGYLLSRRSFHGLGYPMRRQVFTDLGFLTSQQTFTDFGFLTTQQTFTDLNFLTSQQVLDDDDFPIAKDGEYKMTEMAPQSGVVQWTPEQVSIKIDRQPGRSSGWTPRYSWRNLLQTGQMQSWYTGLWGQSTYGKLFKGS